MAFVDSLCIDNTVNETSGTTLNGSQLSTLKPLSASQIAHNLDIKFNLISESITREKDKQSIAKNASTTPTPSHEKGWIPLSQSTPMGVSDSAQPKDLLKAKSKLSKLVHSVATEDQTEIEEEEGKQATHDSEYDQTPSKSKPKERKSSTNTPQSRELEELRRFKEFICKIPQGHLIEELYEKNGDITSLKVQKSKDIIESYAQIERLKKENRDLILSNHDLLKEIQTYKAQETRLQELERQNHSYITRIKIIEEELKVHESSKVESTEKLENLIKELEATRGNPKEAITPSLYPDLVSVRNGGSSIYDELQLSKVDSLTQIQAQNIIKNILINLEIPYSDIKERVTDIGKLLNEEDTLCEFVKKIHRLLYEQDLNLTKYRKELPDASTLKQCTLQMYQNVELLYGVLKKDSPAE